MAEIKVEIDAVNNKITVEGLGYRGGQCVKDIDELMQLLGAQTLSQKVKPEYTVHVGTTRVRR